jgi:hypothetical protein
MTEVKPETEGDQQGSEIPDRTQQINDWIKSGHPDITPPSIFEPIYPPAPEP